MARSQSVAPVTDQDVDTASAETRPYWVGLTDSAPMERIVLAGVEFCRWTETVQPDPTRPGKVARIPHRGRILTLEGDAVERIKAHGREKIIRKVGSRTMVLDRRSPTYRAERGDRPASAYVFAVPAPAGVTSQNSPEALAQ